MAKWGGDRAVEALCAGAVASGTEAPFSSEAPLCSYLPGTPTRLRHNALSLNREEAKGKGNSAKKIPPKHLSLRDEAMSFISRSFFFAL